MRYVILFICLIFLNWSYAQIEETTIEIISSDKQIQPILKEAENIFTQDIIEKTLGEDRLEQVQPVIEEKILPQNKSFILLSKILSKRERTPEEIEEEEKKLQEEEAKEIETLKSEIEGIYQNAEMNKNEKEKLLSKKREELQMKEEKSGEEEVSRKDVLISEIQEIIDNETMDAEEKEKLLTEKNEELKVEEEKVTLVYSVLIKYSKETLQNILIREGLYYTSQGARKILPLIQFTENDDKYSWWSPRFNSSKTSHAKGFYSSLQRFFIQDGFFLLNPLLSQYFHFLPRELSVYYINPKKAQKIAQYFEAQFFILGTAKREAVANDQFEFNWNLVLYSTPHLRELDSYKSKIKFSKESWASLNQLSNYWIKNFILQIKDIYDTGSLSTQLFTIEVTGDLNYLERNYIKKSLIREIPNIKNLITHYVSSEKERYQADVAGTDKEVLEKIKNWKLLEFSFSPSLKSKNYIVIRTKKE